MGPGLAVQQICRAHGADLFIGVEHHRPSQGVGIRCLLECFQRMAHDNESALEVGHARTMQTVGFNAHRLEVGVGGKDGVQMPGQQHASCSLRALANDQCIAHRAVDEGAVVGQLMQRCDSDAFDAVGDGAEQVSQCIGNCIHALCVKAATVDAGQIGGLLAHGVSGIGQGLQRLLMRLLNGLHTIDSSRNRVPGPTAGSRSRAGARHKKGPALGRAFLSGGQRLLADHAELDAAVGFAAFLRVVAGNGLGLAVAHDRQTIGIDAVVDQELLDRHCALF